VPIDDLAEARGLSDESNLAIQGTSVTRSQSILRPPYAM
jgi:hypothetical protein